MTWVTRSRWVPDTHSPHTNYPPAYYHYIFAPSRSWRLIRDEVAADPRYADMPVQLAGLYANVRGRTYRGYEIRLCGWPWNLTLEAWEDFEVKPGVRPIYWDYEIVASPVTERLLSPP